MGLHWLAIILLTSCAPKLSQDCGFVQNSYGQRISWKQNTIRLYLSSNMPAEYKPDFYSAVNKWEEALGRKTFEIIEGDSKQYPEKDRKSGVYFLTEWESDRNNNQGRTYIYWAGNEIYEADIRINVKDFNYYISHKLAGEYSMESLLIHELGHLLGLKHSSDSVMVPTLSAGEDRISLFQDDVRNIQCEYGE